MGHQDVCDSEMNLSDDVESVIQEEIIILVNATGQRVLDRNDSEADSPSLDLLEDAFKRFAWSRPDCGPEVDLRGKLAVRARDALKGNGGSLGFHIFPDSERNGFWAGADCRRLPKDTAERRELHALSTNSIA